MGRRVGRRWRIRIWWWRRRRRATMEKKQEGGGVKDGGV